MVLCFAWAPRCCISDSWWDGVSWVVLLLGLGHKQGCQQADFSWELEWWNLSPSSCKSQGLTLSSKAFIVVLFECLWHYNLSFYATAHGPQRAKAGLLRSGEAQVWN